ncbi:hypothetical protein [Noviherbaspirillum cavernae]|nr:hypothetical protein [Noviherbaspirillum cavernae]
MFSSARLLLLCALTSPLAVAAPARVLSATAYGDITFGSRLVDVEAGLGQKATPAKRDAACAYVSFRKMPKVRFMVENGIVTRADARAGVPNSAGVAVGASLTGVKTRHPDVRITPHKYEDNGHYLIFPDANENAALVMEEVNGKVTAIRGGLQPSVGYVEGCL